MPAPPPATHVLGSKDFDPLAFLGKAGAGRTLQRFRKDQKIFAQGEDADCVFFIRSGKVKITVLSQHGKEAIIGVIDNHQFFGEACLDGAKLRGRTSYAMEDCLITSITKAAMR